MRIRVGNRWFKAEPGCPVMIELDDHDKSLIRDMAPSATRLAYFEGLVSAEEKSEWMSRGEN
jgi:hypothetical protein